MSFRKSVRACAVVVAAAGLAQGVEAQDALSHKLRLENLSSSLLFAPTTVNVNNAETLTPIDLASGSFLGQPFVLGVDTTFEVNSGGVIGPVSGSNVFDFLGSTVNLRGAVAQGSRFLNANLNLFGNSFLDSFFTAGVGTTVNVMGGSVGSVATIEDGAILNLFDGNVSANLNAMSGSQVHISGGRLGGLISKTGSTTTLTGGQVSGAEINGTVNLSGSRVDVLHVLNGGVLNISSGSIPKIRFDDPSSTAGAGSIVNMSGGTIDADFQALSGSVFNLTGGFAGIDFVAHTGSQVNMMGGAIGSGFQVASGSSLNIYGADFQLASLVTPNLNNGLTRGSVFTGTLADGSVFIFNTDAGDQIAPGTVALHAHHLRRLTQLLCLWPPAQALMVSDPVKC